MFKGILITKDEAGYKAQLQQIDAAVLPEGDVTVQVAWSTLNYKDGLAITGKSPVVRRFPMIPGIDFSGTVTESTNPGWKAGDQVVLNGWGVGETHCGGLAEIARVKGEWLVSLPTAFSPRQAMAIGTSHQNLAIPRLDPVFFQRQYAQHGGVTGGANGHRLPRAEVFWQRHQPFTLDPRQLGQPATMGFTDAPAVEHHFVAYFPGRV